MYLLLQPKLQNTETTKLTNGQFILRLITFQRMFVNTIRREQLLKN